MNTTYLKPEERAVYALRELYRGYGYLPFKMSKFEEYDLYVRNKDFLVSDRIITFTDVGGQLLALKPDVTLSIIKNGEDRAGEKQKVCYNENVYRVSGSTHRFKEILQTGLECIGDLDSYDICEVVTLAAASLATISNTYALDISHMGLVGGSLDGAVPLDHHHGVMGFAVGVGDGEDNAKRQADYVCNERGEESHVYGFPNTELEQIFFQQLIKHI